MNYTAIRTQLSQLLWETTPQWLPKPRAAIVETSSLPKTNNPLKTPNSAIQHPGSMTDLLKALAQQQRIQVEVLNEQLMAHYWAREVVLNVDSRSCVWAYSQIPCALCASPLQQQVLGEWLYKEFSVTRSPFTFAKMLTEAPNACTLVLRKSELLLRPKSANQRAMRRAPIARIPIIEGFLSGFYQLTAQLTQTPRVSNFQ